MATLLLAEVAGGKLNDATARALTAALELKAPVDVLVAGSNIGGAAEAAAKLQGVAKVLAADNPLYEHGLAEPLAALIVNLAPGYEAIVAPSTASAKNVAPRVAALIDVMQISDIIKVIGPKTFERPLLSPRPARAARRRLSPSRPPRIRRYRPSSARRSPSPTGRNWPRPKSSSRAAGRCRRQKISRLISSPSPTSSARRWAPPARRSTPATRPTTGRSARPGKSWRPSFTSRS